MPQSEQTRNRQFLMEVEQGIMVANREVLSQRIPPITKENILPLAISVARLRGEYLAEAFRIAENDKGEPPTKEEIETLRHHRQMYEEARLAFEALSHAVERGYVELGK